MKESLLSLAPSDLRSIASALRSGRLSAPISSLGLQRVIGVAASEKTASALQSFVELGSSPAAIAETLELLASAIDSRPTIEDLVELVATGPQVVGVDSRDTGVVVADLLRQSERSVILSGYALYQGRQIFAELAERMEQRHELRVRMYLDIQRKIGDTTASEHLIREFCHRFRSKQWPPNKPLPEIYYDERSLEQDRSNGAALHAKCLVVDGVHVFISSANFTEAAQKRNIELGLLLHSQEIGEKVTTFFNRLVESGQLKRAV